MAEQGKLNYDIQDTFDTLYEQLNNKYLNPIVTSNLILAKAVRGSAEMIASSACSLCFNNGLQITYEGKDCSAKVIHANFGGDDDDTAS